jgi:hypothetical protein
MKKPELLIKENKKAICLDEYAGEWVAFADGKVVAHQGTLDKLMKKVERLKRKPSVFLVPKKKEGPYV